MLSSTKLLKLFNSQKALSTSLHTGAVFSQPLQLDIMFKLIMSIVTSILPLRHIAGQPVSQLAQNVARGLWLRLAEAHEYQLPVRPTRLRHWLKPRHGEQRERQIDQTQHRQLTVVCAEKRDKCLEFFFFNYTATRETHRT